MVKSHGEGASMVSSLRDGGRGSAAVKSRLGRAVVAGQLAIGLVVLFGAGLLMRSFERVRSVHPGFNSAGVTTARVSLPDATYPRGKRQVVFFEQVLGRIAAQPGIAAAGAVSILPESPNFDHTPVKVAGRPYGPNEEATPDVYRVTPGYFAAMQIPLRAGRWFTASDDDRHPLVALVNETMARTLFPDGSAVGGRMWTGAGDAERTIVGVVGDVNQYGLESARTMQLYVPHADNAGGDLTLVVRSATRVPPAATLVRDAVSSVDAAIPVDDVSTMDQVLAASIARRRLLATLALVFALGATGLAAIGLYGLLAYAVTQRIREIGVRMAIGATRAAIVRFVIRDAFAPVLLGVIVGFAIAATLSRLIVPLLFGVSATDVPTLVAAPTALLIVAVGACIVPAFRAASVNPAAALRGE
jgi:putative ABC transport system permease protein